jgi:hypothetical protein
MSQPPSITGYCDSDWGSDPNDRRSVTGYAFVMCGGAVSWQSKRQKSIALSSVEAEYMAARAAAQEAIWWRSFLRDLGHNVTQPTVLHTDNQGSIAIAKNPEWHAKTKHIDIQYHFTREHVADRDVELRYIPTEHMPADTLTKPLAKVKHMETARLLGVKAI